MKNYSIDSFVKRKACDEDENKPKENKSKSPLKKKMKGESSKKEEKEEEKAEPKENTEVKTEEKKEDKKEEKKEMVPPKAIIKKPPSNPNAKFYSSYEEFIDELETWKDPLKDFINPPNNKQMKSIYSFVKKEYETKTIFPPKNMIFHAFKKTPWDKVKVVVIGQDPYPNPGDAMGMSFSVPRQQKIPGSLMNIYKCLEKDKKLNFVRPKHGDLSSWAEQGVFMINATLTVECRKANSHQKSSGWSLFTDYVIKQINMKKEHVVFLLWGNFAIAKSSFINSNKHLIIKNIHPSPLAQNKGDFTKSEQFSQTNEYLKKNGLEEIDWKIVN